MRFFIALSCLAAVGLAGCGKTPSQTKASESAAPAKTCPDIDNRDRNDPCSPLYFKKKGSSLPDKDSF